MPPEDLIRHTFAAFNARDIEVALATMSPNIVWPNAMDGGTVYGRENIREYWTRTWQVADPRVDVISVCQETGGTYAVDVRQVVKDLEGALIFDRVVRQRYRVQDGLIQSMNVRE